MIFICTIIQKIFNSNKFSRLPESTKIKHMKIRGGEKLLDALHYCTFYLAQLIGIIIYLITVYGLLDISSKHLCDGSLHNPTEPLPVFHDRQSHPKCKVQAQPDKESMWYARIQHGLSNVAICMPCVNMHHAGHYQ